MNLAQVQTRLAEMGLYRGAVDGRDGPLTAAALDAFFLARPYARVGVRAWPRSRRIVAAGQLLCMLDGIEVGAIDGLVGPQTRQAFEAYDARRRGIEGVESWRDIESGVAAPPRKGPDAGEVAPRQTNEWPRQSQAEMEKFFGPIGANQTTLAVPAGYPMRIAWDPHKPVARFTCHRRIHDAARRVLARVLDHYGPARIQELGLDLFGGCLNVRRMRGGSAWSMHAWGAALDFDPERNQLKWNKSRARFARPEYEKWWEFWEAEGFISLGRARDFDWMHVQAARL
jgi:hypothetical protein